MENRDDLMPEYCLIEKLTVRPKMKFNFIYLNFYRQGENTFY